ncbi:hypothetical protein ACVW1A_002176 [Bradyrhizobium sp. LB1.3]
MKASEMLTRSDACDAMADTATDPNVVFALREAANQWRALAKQMDLLERTQAYRMIRSSTESSQG